MMPIRLFPVALILPGLLGLLLSQPVSAKKMYRWVDENGKTYLSDQVPPDQTQYRRESLSAKGRVLEVTEQAKSKEQLALDARLEKLKKAQEKIIAKQKSQDKVLLSTYRSIEDMNTSLNKKMQAMDSGINVLQTNLKQIETRLENQLRKAAGLERNGEKIPQILLDDIKSIKTQIETSKTEIDKRREKKQLVRTEFEADIVRYKYLTQSTSAEARKLSDMSSEILAADALGLYQCKDDSDCTKAWEIARQFVNTHSTTATDIVNDTLIMTREPATDNDLSLSISKIDLENKKQQLFLDIRCRQSSLGAELCAGPKVKEIRSAFRTFIESGLKGSNVSD